MHNAHRRTSPLLQSIGQPPRAQARSKTPRLRLNVLADTVSTYLTLLSALILPVLLILWGRSYLVSDRIYHAEDGVAMVAGVSSGELAIWAGPTSEKLDLFQHRSRQANFGQSSRRAFERWAGREHVWFAGFGYATPRQIPWRDVPLTGKGVAFCIPLWFLALIVGALPFRLLARNMQSSAEFLAQRAAERAETPAA